MGTQLCLAPAQAAAQGPAPGSTPRTLCQFLSLAHCRRAVPGAFSPWDGMCSPVEKPGLDSTSGCDYLSEPGSQLNVGPPFHIYEGLRIVRTTEGVNCLTDLEFWLYKMETVLSTHSNAGGTIRERTSGHRTVHLTMAKMVNYSVCITRIHKKTMEPLTLSFTGGGGFH